MGRGGGGGGRGRGRGGGSGGGRGGGRGRGRVHWPASASMGVKPNTYVQNYTKSHNFIME